MLDRQNSAQDVIGFVVSENVAGRRCALLILDIVRGGTLRARGALMAVSENADVRGYISAGCVDGDLVAQASMAFKDNKMRRFVTAPARRIKTLACRAAAILKF